MEQKTKIRAEDGKQELHITRMFELPVESLFKAYTTPEIVAEWMGTNVLQLESRPHGAYRFETSDANGNVVVRMNGVHHEFAPNQKITRTFEMKNTPFAVQLEFLEFVRLTECTSLLNMQIVYKSVELRDQMMRLPFARGINIAHDRLQQIASRSKKM